MSHNITTFKDPDTLADRVSDRLMGRIADSGADPFHLAVSGGSTPNLLFSALARKFSDSPSWQKTHFWWVDERMVPVDDPESNFGTAFRLLLSKIVIPEKNIHRIRGEESPKREVENYARQIKTELTEIDGWPRFDLILLGMGEDGHTASIFPDQTGLLNTGHICRVAHHPVTNQPRITLTGNVLNNACRVWFLVTGSGKAERLAEIISGNEKSLRLPAAFVNPVRGECLWFVDEQAARLIV